ncbi:hypothetical protein BpHYR1_024221 [Brachionus plicatilis]|uniref:Uncharacterized protein n=1 Tax=Brachionus plicatilis TaxID=10195 RepID=A0A3M7PDJ3_BRAPC|nr:hypothetical protein BpHYR1_024221 [Brachionus plicatilis]
MYRRRLLDTNRNLDTYYKYVLLINTFCFPGGCNQLSVKRLSKDIGFELIINKKSLVFETHSQVLIKCKINARDFDKIKIYFHANLELLQIKSIKIDKF